MPKSPVKVALTIPREPFMTALDARLSWEERLLKNPRFLKPEHLYASESVPERSNWEDITQRQIAMVSGLVVANTFSNTHMEMDPDNAWQVAVAGELGKPVFVASESYLRPDLLAAAEIIIVGKSAGKIAERLGA